MSGSHHGGPLGVDPRPQQRGLPAVHVLLGVAGQFQGAVVLVDVSRNTLKHKVTHTLHILLHV